MTPIQTHSFPYVPHGQMAIRNQPANNITITTATSSTSLLPITIGTTYKQITGFSLEDGMGFTFESNGLKVHHNGKYRFGGWAAIRHSANTSTTGVLFAIRRNGVIVGNTPSPVPALMPNVGDVGLIAGEGFVTLQAGDVIEVYVGSDRTGTVTVENCTITGHYLSPY